MGNPMNTVNHTARLLPLLAVMLLPRGAVPGENRPVGEGANPRLPISSRGLPGIPEGVSLGMDLDALKKARPDAYSLTHAFQGTRQKPLEAQKTGEAVFIESQHQNGEGWSASYAFKEGRCVAIAVAHVYKWQAFAECRHKVMASYLRCLGPAYEKRCMERGNSIMTYLAGCLVWKDGRASACLSSMPDFSEVTPVRGELQINILMGDADAELGLQAVQREKEAWLFSALDKVTAEMKGENRK